MQCLVRKTAVLHQEKKSVRGSGFSKKYRKILFVSFSSLYHCVLCQSIVLPSCFLQKHQGCKSKIFSALRAPGLQKQNFLRAARARYKRKGVTQSSIDDCKNFFALRAPAIRENGWSSLALQNFSPRCARQGCKSKIFCFDLTWPELIWPDMT